MPKVSFFTIRPAVHGQQARQHHHPVLAPERLKQTGGGSKSRIERLMNVMFLENVGWDERQLVNGRSEFGGHASRSNGHEANSGDSRGNLRHAIGQPGLLSWRWLISARSEHVSEASNPTSNKLRT
jgi:hypothetical protein